MKPKCALIDMDGVLYDSMKYHTLAWQKMMAEYGVVCDRDEFYLYEGMTGAATINLIFRREKGREASEEEIREMYHRKTELFNELGRKEVMPGAQDMVSALIEAGVTTVLVTGSGQGSLLGRLDEDYHGAFPPERRVTAHDVKHGKPNPEPYLMGLQKAGCSPEEAIVIENAPLGVQAGVAAGVRTMAVTTGPIPREAFEAKKPTCIFASMPEFAKWLRTDLLAAGGEDLPQARELSAKLTEAVARVNPAEGQLFVITDVNVDRLVLPRLAAGCPELGKAHKIVIPAGEEHKDVETLARVWRELSENGATRRSVIINIGGGLVTDLGGFAAATFKRGVRCINVPTTLLGAVDAATGGKTGINLMNFKNEVGAFSMPAEVVISGEPFETLSVSELLSGYGEMIKTALIADPRLYVILMRWNHFIEEPASLTPVVLRCVEIKNGIVTADPHEHGIRKALNFGHTAGHAFETLCLENGTPVPHGTAVAHGMLVELILSHIAVGMPSDFIYPYSALLKEAYPRLQVKCTDVDRLYALMGHDKKNNGAGRPNFTLLRRIGEPIVDCEPSEEDIRAALDIYLNEM